MGRLRSKDRKKRERSEKEDGGSDRGQEKRNDKHRVLQTIW